MRINTHTEHQWPSDHRVAFNSTVVMQPPNFNLKWCHFSDSFCHSEVKLVSSFQLFARWPFRRCWAGFTLGRGRRSWYRGRVQLLGHILFVIDCSMSSDRTGAHTTLQKVLDGAAMESEHKSVVRYVVNRLVKAVQQMLKNIIPHKT